ncbi:hypothetical protein GOP47_0015662 [Adiantum capillus-veneris]|uniref:Uncharacterized protein n=1 Tax=Adiantum capillus-veneris TaxID=13818 RepID=A0A9D4UL05_ADICA|nr:hypothetical protein GOP47_0015662 [Adiantum capillus-veneris]
MPLSGRQEGDDVDSPTPTPHPSDSRIPPMILIPGSSSKYAKKAIVKLIKMAQVEFDLPRKHVNVMCNEFEVFHPYYCPNKVARFGLGTKICISKNEYGVYKYERGDGPIPRTYVKEACIYLHLRELQGTKIPELLSYGSADCLGYPGFFLITRYHGDPLKPEEVSPSEFGELLSEIHEHGILISSPDSIFAGFPTLVRYGSTLMFGEIPTAACFNKDAQRFEEEFDFFVGLCKKEDEG